MSATRRDAVSAGGAVVGNGGNVTNEGNLETGGVDRAHGGFTTGTRSLHVDTHSAHAVVLSLAGGLFGSNLRGKGVDLREPLNPLCPALAQLTVFPRVSVKVMIVLLNEAWM